MNINAIILRGDLEGSILGVRAAKWLLRQPLEKRDAILTYSDLHTYGDGWSVCVKRNKASITAYIQRTR